MLARTAFCHQRLRIVAEFGREQCLDRGPDAVDDGSQATRLLPRRLLQLVQGRGTAPHCVWPEHDDQRRAELGGGKLDAADLRRGDDVARNADDKQVAEALVEDDLGRHPGVGASEDDSERFLAGGELVTALRAGQRCRGSGHQPRTGDCRR